MERDEADEQLAYHLLSVAKATGRPEDLRACVGQLLKSFGTRPQAKQLFELAEIVRRTGDGTLFERLAPYLHPSALGEGAASAD